MPESQKRDSSTGVFFLSFTKFLRTPFLLSTSGRLLLFRHWPKVGTALQTCNFLMFSEKCCKWQPRKMVRHTQVHSNKLFDHLVELALKGLLTDKVV